uniref:SFRICE_038107 n=1 Tax=Spodoptera frugiperda TaxID=7108 RepID=A0A2H1VBQ3_SPOFR
MTDASGTTKTQATDKEAEESNVSKKDKLSQKEKEIPVVHDQGFFQHSTGDTYDGYFEAKKKDHALKMHGFGVYTTAEGDRYEGHWDQDRFGWNDEVVISYIEGAKYEGTVKDWSYSGKGKYTYPDGSHLQCEFADNCPTGNLRLTDPNGHLWLGKAELGFAWFEPVNHFYDFLETTSATRKRRKGLHASSSQMSKKSLRSRSSRQRLAASHSNPKIKR